MLQQTCPWTAAAIATEEHSRRARDAAHDMRKVAGSVDDLFGGVIKDALALADKEDRMADSLVWVGDWCIFAAMHPEAVRQFREAIESGKSYGEAERRALRATRQTMPVGGPVVAALDRVSAG